MLSFEEADILKETFFAKRVLSVIKEGGQVDQTKRVLFERILKYLDTIEDGKQQVVTGNLVEHPVRSISAYRKAIEIVSVLEDDKHEEDVRELINSILGRVRKEVEEIVNEENDISIAKLQTTYDYFREARKLALHESSRDSINGQELVTWQTPMQF